MVRIPGHYCYTGRGMAPAAVGCQVRDQRHGCLGGAPPRDRHFRADCAMYELLQGLHAQLVCCRTAGKRQSFHAHALSCGRDTA